MTGMTAMQIRSKAYLQVVARLRALRVRLQQSDDATAQEVSPLLIYLAAVLALLLAILEIDLHSAELQSLGLLGNPQINPIFMSP
jgi:hypothetical protein